MESQWINGGTAVWPFLLGIFYIAYYAFAQDRKKQKEKALRKARKKAKH